MRPLPLLLALVLGAAVVLAGCGGPDPVEEARRFSGELEVAGATTLYEIEVPPGWEGDLLLHAHGLVDPRQPLAVVRPDLAEVALREGWAWGAASYSANGYVADRAVDELDALRTRFAEITGLDPPTRTIISGDSMGGHITALAVERRPDAYVGALPFCGVMGDAVTFDYLQDVTLVAAALAGVEVEFPPGEGYVPGQVARIVGALGLSGGLTPAGEVYAAAVEALSGGDRPTFEESFARWEVDPPVPVLQLLYGAGLVGGAADPPGVLEAFDNTDTRYELAPADGDLDDVERALNAQVLRVTATGDSPVPAVEGRPHVPTLSLHTTGDLFVPLVNQQVYAAEAAAAGLADNLVTRTVRSADHCDFTAEERATAFTDLVTWIGEGERPDGEDLLDPVVVADPSLGCAFTTTRREGMPPC